MILSPNRSSRSGKTVRLVVVHTAEGARTVQSLGSYFSSPSVQASSHAGIDDQTIETYVPYDSAAWTLRSGNSISDNAELCGFAAWTRAQWLNEHRRMLDLTAQWIRERCQARGIPIRKLTPQQVAAGQPGVIGHYDWTIGMRDGSHTDPGPGFPWDYVIDQAARGASALVAPPPPPHMATKEDLAAVINAAIDAKLGRTIWETTGTLPNRRGPGGSELKGGGGDSMWGYSINADGFGYRIEQKLDQLIDLVKAAGVDPAAVTAAITEALGGGLDITGTATPKRSA
jgi:hypothetical protein